MKKRRIYFYANFGDFNKPPYGGGEAGNRKTYDLFKNMNVEVKLIPKYKHSDDKSIIGKLISSIRVISNFLYFYFLLLFGRRSNSIVHISGYYGGMIFFERILIVITKLLGYKVVYEMRAGGAQYKYEHFSDNWRKHFRYMIKSADVVFSQGLENIPLLKKIDPDVDVHYYPNYVMSGFYSTVYPKKPNNSLNIMYFGRLSKYKNIDLIIDTFNIVASNIINAKLLLVGDYINNEYQDIVQNKITKSKFKDRIDVLPAHTKEALVELMKDQHIFLFPSAEPGEGHSNALTEAMAWGLVPVASPQGFNRGVIDNDYLIIDKYIADDYAKAIIKIVSEDQLEEYSKKCYNRVMEFYTDIKVHKRLISKYDKMFKDFFGDSCD